MVSDLTRHHYNNNRYNNNYEGYNNCPFKYENSNHLTLTVS